MKTKHPMKRLHEVKKTKLKKPSHLLPTTLWINLKWISLHPQKVMNLNETEKYSLINTHLSSQFNYSTFLLMCKCFPSQMNALWSTLFVQINKENKDPFSHLCVCDRAALSISNHFFSNPSPRRRSWSACHLWAWLCSICTSLLTRPWRSAPTRCSGCRDVVSLPAPSTRFLCARSSPTRRPSTSAASLSRWASPEPPACWRFVFSLNLLDFISVLKICSTALTLIF